MHKSIVEVGLFLGAIIVLSGTQQAEALTVDELLATNSIAISSTEVVNEADNQEKEKKSEDKNYKEDNKIEGEVLSANTQIEEPKEHIVESGQSLSRIADLYQTTWKRLYDKNSNIIDPNIIRVGEKIIIPVESEVLVARELPVATPVAVATPIPVKAKSSTSSAPKTYSSAPRGSSSGNLYTFGYCTWYVKNRRPDLPNNLGNANTWVSRARAQGLPTGTTPRVGAVGQKGMHVVYVESVNGDGTVTISEMNREGFNVRSSRTVPASYFQYIY